MRENGSTQTPGRIRALSERFMLAITFQHIRNPTDAWFIVKRAVFKRFLEQRMDLELHQLRTLNKAYSKDEGPEILIFGDSAMVYTTASDPKRLSLGDMIQSELGSDVSILTVGGLGYGPRIVGAFMSALEGSRSLPSVILVPASLLTSMPAFFDHPRLGHVHEAKSIREIVDHGGKVPWKGVARATAEEYEQYDRLPAPSLIGARRTIGELRLIMNSVPATRWATAIRMRHVMDYYNAKRLEPDDPGVIQLRQLGEQVAALEVQTVAYIAPVNYTVMNTTLGEASREHLTRNAEVVSSSFLDAAGEFGHVVNAVFDNPSSEFIDPIHLSFEGRQRLAAHLIESIRPLVRAGAKSTKDRKSS